MARTSAVASHTERRHVVGRLRGLSVILPCHDEAQNVERAIDEATAAGELVADAHEILVVDDGSTDATRDLAQARAAADPRVRVLVHDGNRGYGAAVRTGIAAARLEWLFLTDADLQFDMGELTRFVPLAQSTDIIAGFRTHRADPPHRLLNAAAWNALVRRVFDVPLRDVDCAFKLMRRELVQPLPLAAEGAMVSTELVTRARDAGARIAELGVGHRPRVAGRSSGASPRVVLRAFRELRAVRAELREGEPAGAPADLARAIPAGAPADLSRATAAGAPADPSRAIPAGAPADLSRATAAGAPAGPSRAIPAGASADLSGGTPGDLSHPRAA